jgi:nucleotide-binding universal stress UspA family protein
MRETIMNRFRKILVDVDASAMAQPALAWATSFARRSRARVRLVHVMSAADEDRSVSGPGLHDELVRIRRQQLVRMAAKSPDVVDSVAVLSGDPVEALIHEVQVRGLDLVVRHDHRDLPAADRDRQTALDVELFRRCPCAVLSIGGRVSANPRVAVAVDVDVADPVKYVAATSLVDAGLVIARRMGGSLSLVHAWQPPDEMPAVTDSPPITYGEYIAATRCQAVRTLAGLADAGEGHLTRRLSVKHGPPSEVIPEYVASEGVDLLLVGTADPAAVAGPIRNTTAERLLARTRCSVMAVRVPVPVAVEKRIVELT